MKKYYIQFLGVVVVLALSFASRTPVFAQPGQFIPYPISPATGGNAWQNDLESLQCQNPNQDGLYNLRFRLMKPNGWASSGPNDKFPLIVFFHGSGESAPGDPALQNNTAQLVHGGKRHHDAVADGTFPGFLLYPQMRRTGQGCGNNGDYSNNVCNANNWGTHWREAVKYVIDKLITEYKVDPNRIYVHGLSGGGESTWQFMTSYPEYVAAAHPMSAAGNQFHSSEESGFKEYYKHIPIRLSQGGTDGNPTPAEGNSIVEAVRSVGGSIRYHYYPSLGHDTWNSQYNRSDFFSWFLQYNKKNPAILFEQPLACPGDPVDVRIGYSRTIYPNGRGNSDVPSPYRIINYQWARGSTDNVVLTGSEYNEIRIHSSAGLSTDGVCTPGVYYGRFQRATGGWSEWSDPIVVNDTRGPSPAPVISANGKSTTLPTLEGSSQAILSGPAGQAAYQWKRGGNNISGANDVLYSAVQAGTYTLSIKSAAGDPYQLPGVPAEFRPAPPGCFSGDSNPIVVTTSNGLGVPAPPGNFFASTATLTSLNISWEDRSDNETGFELYRSTDPEAGYTLVTIIPASNGVNPLTYLDTNLQPSTTYYYRMRAVNNEGGSAYTPVASASTTIDNVPPTAPVLVVNGTSRTVINLSWHSATDNVGVTSYEIYQNGALIATTSNTNYSATSLVALASYNYVVKAKDAFGNVSPPSNQVNVVAANSGLFYRYYHHNGLTSTEEIETLGTLMGEGNISTFSIASPPRQRSDNFAFIYEGFININSSGNYTFYTSSDDGSRLYINNNLIVNNDGAHGTQERSGSVSLSPGQYPIKVKFFENGGGEALTVSYSGPGISKRTIPNSALSDNYSSPSPLTNPSNFSAVAESYEQINLSWWDNSNNETGFEISRATTSNGTYQVVHVAPAGAGTGSTRTWSDTGLPAGTQFFYRVRAINANSQSSTVGPVNATTLAAPPTPAVPTNLTATPISPTQINLSWSNVAGESGYTIQRSMNSSTGFVDLATVDANITTYSNTDLLGNTTAYYRVRSNGPGGSSSGWSAVASATTANRSPVFNPIPDQTLAQNQLAPQTIAFSAIDPDQDPISFSFTGLPQGASFADDGYGRGVLTFVNVAQGVYNVQGQATDGVDVAFDSFVLTVEDNAAPVIWAVSVNGQTISPTPVAIQDQSTEAGRTLVLDIIVEDPDGNGELSINPITTGGISNLPGFATASWAAVENSRRRLRLTFNTTVNSVGVYENITINFRDSEGGINSQSFSLIVNPVDLSYSIAINFIQSADDAEGPPWNNTPTPPNFASSRTMSNLKDESGNVVNFVDFFIPADFNNITYSGTLPNSPNAVYTEKVRRSYYTKSTGSTRTSVTREFIFRNLNPALKYRVTGYAAQPYSVSSGTWFTVTGATTQALEDLPTYNNLTETRTSDFMFPTSNGQIRVLVGGTQTYSIFFLNSLILEASYIEEAPPAAPSGVVLAAPLNTRVEVTWTDNSLNEQGFRVYRSTTANDPNPTLVGEVPTNIKTFTDNNAVGRTTYYYRVKAFNAYGESAFSDVGIITTPNGAPIVENPGTAVVTAGNIVQVNISASDPEGDPLTLGGLNLPDFATLVDNGNGTGYIRFTPTVDDVGIYELTVSATDNYSASAEAIFPLVVSDPNVLETVYINLTASGAASAIAPWNNVSFNASLPLTLKNSAGQNSMSINRSETSNNWLDPSDNVGVSTGDNSGRYPDKVLQSGWISARAGTVGTTDPQNSQNNATITLSGLNSNRRYNITILGSRNEFKFADAIYTVTAGSVGSGSLSQTLNTRKNRDGVVRFIGVTPNGSGNIRISVKRSNADENAGQLPVMDPYVTINHEPAVINAIVVEVYTSVNALPTPKDFKATPIAPLTSGSNTRSVLLTWSDDAWNETRYEIRRAEDPAGPFTTIHQSASNATSFTDTNRPPNKAYVYQIRVVRTGGNALTSAWSQPVMVTTYDKVILVHVSGPDLTAPQPWNTVASFPSDMGANYTMYNLQDVNQQATPYDLELVDITTVGVRPDRGYSGASVGYPNAVKLSNFLYEANSTSTWRLRELDPHASYDLAFFGTEWEGNGYKGASRSRHNERVVTEYVVGQEKKAIYNAKNSELAIFSNLKPQAGDSTLTFDVNAYVGEDAIATAAFFNAIEIRTYTSPEAQFDKEAPTTPTNLVATNIASDSVRLTWEESTDNVGVIGYQIYNGTDLVTEVFGVTTVRLEDLQPSTNYVFSVRARDLKGNWSGFSDPVPVTTLSANATNFYSKANGDITNLATWGTNENGSDAAPSAFNNANQHFHLNRNATIGSSMDLFASNTRLIVKEGVQLTINSQVTGVVDAEANASIVINTASAPTLGTLDATSTVSYEAATTTIPGASYGNLVLGGSQANFSAGNYVIQGDLTLDGNISLVGAENNQTVLNISGDLIATGVQLPADNLLPKINFISSGTQTLSIGAGNLRLSEIGVSNSSTVKVEAPAPSTITLGTANGGGLTIAEGSTFELGPNNLVIQGAAAINGANETGQLAVNKSEISILSSGTQLSNLYFKEESDTVKALHLNAHSTAQVTIRSRMYVDEQLDVQSGRVNAEGNVVLVSTENYTARIPKIGTNGSILGGVEFQRAMGAVRAYRYMAAPVYNSTIADWQGELRITGPFPGNDNGQSPSIYYWNEAQGGWVQFPGPNGSTASTFELGRGYSVFQYDNVNNKKLRITGPIHQGDFTYTNLSPSDETHAGWNLLGNVYASPIRWGEEGWQRNDVMDMVAVRVNSGPQPGGVKYYIPSTQTGDQDFAGVIAPGQSFWVRASGSEPSIVVTEDAKVNENDISFYRQRGPVNQLMVSLSRGQVQDKAYIHFGEESTDAIDAKFDAPKRSNDYFNLSTVVDAKDFAINSMSLEFCQKRIPINISNTTAGSYKLAFEHIGTFEFEPEMALVDHLTSEELVVNDGFEYAFNITSDPATFGKDRFELIVKKAPVNPETNFQLSTSSFCNSSDLPIVTIANSQKGVLYHVVSQSDTLQTLVGTGGSIQAAINVAKLPIAAHNVQILARNKGCETVTLAHSESINVVNKPVVKLVDDLLISSGIAEGDVQWYKDGHPIFGATNPTLTPGESSSYAVEVTAFGCTVRSDEFDYVVTGLENPFDDAPIQLYPNPVEKILTITFQRALAKRGTVPVTVHNAMGQVVLQMTVEARMGSTELNVAELPAGLYTMTIDTAEGTTQRRFVKQ